MPETAMFVYVSQQGSNQITVFRLSPSNGELNKIQDIAVSGKAMPLAVSPDRRFLFCALRTEPYRIASFAIDGASGMLTHLGNAPAVESSPYIACDRTGRFLLAAYNPEKEAEGRRTGWISVSAIGPHGHVHAPHQVIRTPPKTHAIQPDPSNRFAFIPSCDGDCMVRYRFDAAIGLFEPEPLPPVLVQPRAGPRHFAFHPNNRFMYLLNEYDGSLYTFSYDARSGALGELQVTSTLPANFDKEIARTADINFTPDGKWLYTSIRNVPMLVAFKVDGLTGLVTPAGHFPAASEPRGFRIDPFGRYLLAAGLKTHTVTSFRIDTESGGLTRLGEYPTGEGPNWIEIVRLP